MGKSDQNARVGNRTNEKNKQNVTSLAIIPEQNEKADNANRVVATDRKSQKKNGPYMEKDKKGQSTIKEPIQRENIRYY